MNGVNGASYCRCQTEIGPLWVGWTDRGINWIGFSSPPKGAARLDQSRQAELTQILNNWFTGSEYDGPLDLTELPVFTQKVLAKVREIPRGEVRSYGWVAREVGRPHAARAVGNALARNPIPLLIPCHRIIPQSGRLGQYSGGGPRMKAHLLALEGAVLPDGTSLSLYLPFFSQDSR